MHRCHYLTSSISPLMGPWKHLHIQKDLNRYCCIIFYPSLIFRAFYKLGYGIHSFHFGFRALPNVCPRNIDTGFDTVQDSSSKPCVLLALEDTVR